MNKMVVIHEFKCDLFASDNNMAHCVSADLSMSLGIALTFKNKFGKVDELMKQNRFIGSAPFIMSNDKFIYYLVTKEKYYQKPEIGNLILCLINMRKHLIANNIKHISIPKLGCGLDGLSWLTVKGHIYNIFQNDDIVIDVYYL